MQIENISIEAKKVSLTNMISCSIFIPIIKLRLREIKKNFEIISLTQKRKAFL